MTQSYFEFNDRLEEGDRYLIFKKITTLFCAGGVKAPLRNTDRPVTAGQRRLKIYVNDKLNPFGIAHFQNISLCLTNYFTHLSARVNGANPLFFTKIKFF